MDSKQVRWKVLDWIHTAEGRGQWVAVVNKVMKLSSRN
jgi:hypothetical protein